MRTDARGPRGARDGVLVHGSRFWNEDCVAGARRHLADASVDLVITDPPYGIDGDRLHRHYNRKEAHVVDGYVEVPASEYADFSRRWIREAERALRPGGSMYVMSGWSNLHHVLNALHASGLEEVNHVVWKYSFGVFTSTKYVTSHYHVLYWAKPGGKRTFETEARFGLGEKAGDGGSLNYRDREDVWDVPREYKPGRAKNKNELPTALLVKMLQYSSRPGDLVADLFLGGFSTARVAIGLGRRATGFELNRAAFERGVSDLARVAPGDLLPTLRAPEPQPRGNRRRPWDPDALRALHARHRALVGEGRSKKDALAALQEEFGRGRWAVEKALKRSP